MKKKKITSLFLICVQCSWMVNLKFLVMIMKRRVAPSLIATGVILVTSMILTVYLGMIGNSLLITQPMS